MLAGTVESKGGPSERVRLFDVSISAGVLNHTVGRNPGIFRDLGTGTSYADFAVSEEQAGTTITVPLNRDAIHDLNAARGGFFSIGGRLMSISAGGQDFVFGASEGNVTRLVLRTAPSRPAT